MEKPPRGRDLRDPHSDTNAGSLLVRDCNVRMHSDVNARTINNELETQH